MKTSAKIMTNVIIGILLSLTLLSYNNYALSAELPDLSQFNVNDLQSQLAPEFANPNISLDDAKNLLRDKCIETASGNKEAGTKAFEEIETSAATLMECVNNIINFTAIQEEIEEAKPRGELDVVFNKYCAKRPEALMCVENFNSKLVPCLDADEQANKDVFMRIVTSLLNFICHKGGDQIALFIAEKGPECLSSKKDEIQNCVNITMSNYLPKEGGLESLKTKKLPKFVMGEKQCHELQHMETCIVEHLEKCTDITPANLVESMFRFIRNETICRTTRKASASPQAGPVNLASSGVMQANNIILGALMVLTIVFVQLFDNKPK